MTLRATGWRVEKKGHASGGFGRGMCLYAKVKNEPSFHQIFCVKLSEILCKHPESIKDGYIEVANFRGSYHFGSRAMYHCNPGFILWGNTSLTCGTRGQWEGGTPG